AVAAVRKRPAGLRRDRRAQGSWGSADLRAAVIGQEDLGVVHQQEATGAAEVTPSRLQRFENCPLVYRQAREPVDPATVAEKQTIDVDLGGNPAQRQGILRPVELGLFPRVRLEAAS